MLFRSVGWRRRRPRRRRSAFQNASSTYGLGGDLQWAVLSLSAQARSASPRQARVRIFSGRFPIAAGGNSTRTTTTINSVNLRPLRSPETPYTYHLASDDIKNMSPLCFFTIFSSQRPERPTSSLPTPGGPLTPQPCKLRNKRTHVKHGTTCTNAIDRRPPEQFHRANNYTVSPSVHVEHELSTKT